MSSSSMLLSKILESPQRLLEAKRLGVTERSFYSTEEKAAWAMVDAYYHKHGNVPEVQHLQKLVPDFTLMEVGGRNVSELVDRVHKERMELEIRTAMYNVEGHLATENFSAAIADLFKGASIASQGFGLSKDVSLLRNAEDIYYAYLDTKEKGILRGIPWPWKPLTEATGGLYGGSYNVIYGRMKSTKTFRLLECAVAAKKHNKRTLVVSCEMPDMKLLARLAAIECGLDVDAMRRGLLTEEQERILQEYSLSQAEQEHTREIVITQLSDSSDGKTVSSLRAKIDEYEPDLILVDSFYKMIDEQTGKRDSSPQTIRNISADIQQLSQAVSLPFVVTSQANRSGDKAKSGATTDVAFADAMAMDCDLLVRLVNDADLGRSVFLVNAARDAVIDGFSVGNRMCDGMGVILRPDGTEDWSIPAKYREEDGGSGGEQKPAQRQHVSMEDRFL